MAEKQYAIDIDGTEIVSTALMALLNRFPGLDGKEITFSTLSDTAGIGFFPTSGAVILSDKEDVTGHVRQVCMYPFSVVYRAAPKTETQKLRIKELLDAIGKWLERQPVVIKGEMYQLEKYPDLGKGREIKSISRKNPGHLNGTYQDGVEDWAIAATLQYEVEFDR